MSRITLSIAFWIAVIVVAVFVLDAIGGDWLKGHEFAQLGLAAVFGGLSAGLIGFWGFRQL